MNDLTIRGILPKYLQRYFLGLQPGKKPTVDDFKGYLSLNTISDELGENAESIAHWCSNPNNLSNASLSRLLACTQNNLNQLQADLMDNLPITESKAYWVDDGRGVYTKAEVLFLDEPQVISLIDPNKARGPIVVSNEEIERVNKENKDAGIKLELIEDGKKIKISAFNHSAQILSKLPIVIDIKGKRSNGDDAQVYFHIKDIKDKPTDPGSFGKAMPWIAVGGGGLLSLFSIFSNSENKLNSILGILGGALIALAYPIYSSYNRKYSNLQTEGNTEKAPKNKDK